MRRLNTLNVVVCHAKRRKGTSERAFDGEEVGGIMRRLGLRRLSIDSRCWEVGLAQSVLEA